MGECLYACMSICLYSRMHVSFIGVCLSALYLCAYMRVFEYACVGVSVCTCERLYVLRMYLYVRVL